jgi:predicted Zn-dependent protease
MRARGKTIKGKMMIRLLGAGALALALVAGAPPVRAQIFMSPQQEKQVGADEHKKIVPQFGGLYTERNLGGYVSNLGQTLARSSDDPSIGYTFTLLNSPIVNAFALPGGYVYVTRGLLALANSEAELGGVIGHEVGHVTGHHTAKRYDRAVGSAILGGLLGALTGSQIVGNIANLGGQAYVAGFSRSQEYEADLKGVRTLARAGYDPFAQADFLDTLRREEQLTSKLSGQEKARFQFFATHPNTADRVQKAAEEAQKQGVGGPYGKPRKRNDYLSQIDGMIYGDDPKQGFIRGRTFSHPDLRIKFTVPPGFALQNSDEAVAARAQDGSMIIFDGGRVAPGTDPVRYLQSDFAEEIKAQPQNIRAFDVNGLRAASGLAQGQTESGQVIVKMVAIQPSPQQMYRFLCLAPADGFGAREAGFDQTIRSFQRLSNQEASALKPLRIRVVTAGAGDTAQSLAARMVFEDFREERFRVLNGLNPGDAVKSGERYKIIQ